MDLAIKITTRVWVDRPKLKKQKLQQEFGRSTQTVLTSHLGFLSFAFSFSLGGPTIKLPHLLWGHDIPYPWSLVGFLLVPHVEIPRDVAELGLIVRPHHQCLPNLKISLLLVGIILLGRLLDYLWCLHTVLAVYQPKLPLWIVNHNCQG